MHDETKHNDATPSVDDGKRERRHSRRCPHSFPRDVPRAMTSKEALAATTVFSRNHVVWFMLFWALAMFIIDGIVFSTDPPPGENRWEYGPSVFLVCLVRRDAKRRRGRAMGISIDRSSSRVFGGTREEDERGGE